MRWPLSKLGLIKIENNDYIKPKYIKRFNMKYFLNSAIFLFLSLHGLGQIMQASIGIGSSQSRIKIYIKPVTAVNGFINTFEFDVAISAGTTPIPTLSIIGTPAFGITWFADASFVEGGYRHYHFINLTNPSISIGAGVETQIMELQFSGSFNVSNNVSLVTLPGGGVNSMAWYIFSGTAGASVSGQLYYARSGTTVINNMSYLGPLPSSATLGAVLLPLNMLSLNIVKQGNDGIINWSVAKGHTDHHYELQRSNNGKDFTTIATINRSANGNTSYQYTDERINNLLATILYYRIKQVDINGKINYSDIRSLKLDIKINQITIFPNPVKEGFNISIPFANSSNALVKLNLVGANGQMIRSKELNAIQATNYYFSISDLNLTAGNYYLQIMVMDKLLETKKIFIVK